MISFSVALLSCYISIPIGLLSNLLSIGIFSTKQFLKQSVSIYLIFICCLNIFDIAQIPHQLQLFSYTSDISLVCKISLGIMIYLNLMQTWIAVIATIDCLLTIQKPLKFGFKKIKKLQVGFILMVSALILIESFPMFYIKDAYFITDSNQTICSYPLEIDYLWGKYYTLVNITLFTSVIPYSIMIVTSIYLIKALRKPKDQEVFVDKLRVQDINSAIMIIVYDLLLSVTSSPILFYNTYFDFSDNIIFEILLLIADFLKIFSFMFFTSSLALFRLTIFQAFKNVFCFKKKKILKITLTINQAASSGDLSRITN
jgi:hypothetical protein